LAFPIVDCGAVGRRVADREDSEVSRCSRLGNRRVDHNGTRNQGNAALSGDLKGSIAVCRERRAAIGPARSACVDESTRRKGVEPRPLRLGSGQGVAKGEQERGDGREHPQIEGAPPTPAGSTSWQDNTFVVQCDLDQSRTCKVETSPRSGPNPLIPWRLVCGRSAGVPKNVVA